MGAHEPHEWLDGWTRKIIRIKAWRLAQGPGFRPDDKEDIEQELILDLLLRAPKFDPARGNRQAFIGRVLDNKVADLVAANVAAKRDRRREVFSLDEPVVTDGEGEIPRQEILDPGRIDEDARSGMRDADLWIDLGRRIYSIRPDLAALCLQLSEKRIAEVSREMGIPRATLYGRIAELRRILSIRGLRDYL